MVNWHYFCVSNLNAHFKKRVIVPYFLLFHVFCVVKKQNKRGKETKLVPRNLLANIILHIWKCKYLERKKVYMDSNFISNLVETIPQKTLVVHDWECVNWADRLSSGRERIGPTPIFSKYLKIKWIIMSPV